MEKEDLSEAPVAMVYRPGGLLMEAARKVALAGIIACSVCAVKGSTEAGAARQLDTIARFTFDVQYSPGHHDRALAMAQLCDRAMHFMDVQLAFAPRFQLLVLAEEDWSVHTDFPVYGMPHPSNDSTLVVAAEDNAFWRSFIPDLAQLPVELAEDVRAAYGAPDGSLSVQPFFDLLVLHELGHLYHLQRPVVMPRMWLGELFCNVFLHTFIAEREPSKLQALTVFPRMVVARGLDGFEFTTLPELEANYALITTQHPANYGWYQCRWHVAAADIHDQGGAEVLRRFWDCFAVLDGQLDDIALAVRLRDMVHARVAEVMTKW